MAALTMNILRLIGQNALIGKDVPPAPCAYGQKIYPSQFREKRHRVNSHRSQPHAQQLNPAQTAAAQSEHDPSALLCLDPATNTAAAHAVPPHTSQALEHRTAQQPNTHRPASSKLTFEPVKCTGPGTPSARTPKQLQYATVVKLHQFITGQCLVFQRCSRRHPVFIRGRVMFAVFEHDFREVRSQSGNR